MRVFDKESGGFYEELAGVSLDELHQLFDATHSMFGALSFGAAYDTLAGDLTPAAVGGKPTRPCHAWAGLQRASSSFRDLAAALIRTALAHRSNRLPKIQAFARRTGKRELLRAESSLCRCAVPAPLRLRLGARSLTVAARKERTIPVSSGLAMH